MQHRLAVHDQFAAFQGGQQLRFECDVPRRAGGPGRPFRPWMVLQGPVFSCLLSRVHGVVGGAEEVLGHILWAGDGDADAGDELMR